MRNIKLDFQLVTNVPAYDNELFMLPSFGIEYVKRPTYDYVTLVFVVARFNVGFRIYFLSKLFH